MRLSYDYRLHSLRGIHEFQNNNSPFHIMHIPPAAFFLLYLVTMYLKSPRLSKDLSETWKSLNLLRGPLFVHRLQNSELRNPQWTANFKVSYLLPLFGPKFGHLNAWIWPLGTKPSECSKPNNYSFIIEVNSPSNATKFVAQTEAIISV